MKAKAKVAVLHDLRGKWSDCILTKQDCEMIKKALLDTYEWDKIAYICTHFSKLTSK